MNGKDQKNNLKTGGDPTGQTLSSTVQERLDAMTSSVQVVVADVNALKEQAKKYSGDAKVLNDKTEVMQKDIIDQKSILVLGFIILLVMVATLLITVIDIAMDHSNSGVLEQEMLQDGLKK